MFKRVILSAIFVLVLGSAVFYGGCSSSNSNLPTMTNTTPASATPSGITINLTAQNFSFSPASISVQAGARVTIVLNNMDNGVPHNFALYTDSSASTAIFKGQNVTGPNTVTYTFNAPSTPGNYFFRCDVHPTQMTGTFTVS